jgi:hypothetical protein
LNRLIGRVAGKRRTSFIRIAFDDLVDLYLSHLDETGETWEKAVDAIEANKKNRRYKSAHNTVKGLIEEHRDALREEYRRKGVTSYEPVRHALATNLEQARDRVNATKQEAPATKPLLPPRMWRSRGR